MGRPQVPRVTVECLNCGKQIERRVSDVKRNKSGRFFCSTACREALGSKPRTVRPKKCEWCGASFTAYGARPGRFCSNEHYHAWMSRNRVEKTCETCGKNFMLKPSQAEHLTGRWCSRECEVESRLKRKLGRRHNGRPVVLDQQGYVRIFEPTHPRAMGGGWVFEHRWLMEQRLGRHLERDEHVHHVNGQKDDNRPENLVVLGHSEHSTLTAQENREAQEAMRAELDEYRRRFGPL